MMSNKGLDGIELKYKIKIGTRQDLELRQEIIVFFSRDFYLMRELKKITEL